MIKYAKVVNKETGLCEVGLGTNNQFYQSIGMTELDVQQSDVDNNWYLTELCPMKTDEEKEREERERLNKLSMTKREMFLGLYQAKGITPDMLKAQIVDPQALIEFEYANDYFRGNPLINEIGAKLGFTTEQLDKFFETKDYHYLTTCTLTINTIPENAIVTINEVEQNTITLPYETIVDYKVECEGYLEQIGQIQLVENKTIVVELVKEEQADNE